MPDSSPASIYPTHEYATSAALRRNSPLACAAALGRRVAPSTVITSLVVALTWTLLIPGAAISEALPSFDRVRILETPRVVQDAELTDHNGNPFLLSSLQGKVALVLFGFTNCEEVCSPAMERMRQLRSSNRIDADEMAYVIISVDGERDTPEVMREYLQKISPNFIGLTGDSAAIKPIAANFRASFYKENSGSDPDYDVTHSTQMFMLDPAGRVRAEMYGASVEAMSGVALALLREVQD